MSFSALSFQRVCKMIHYELKTKGHSLHVNHGSLEVWDIYTQTFSYTLCTNEYVYKLGSVYHNPELLAEDLTSSDLVRRCSAVVYVKEMEDGSC
jgi:hypothetical protein